MNKKIVKKISILSSVFIIDLLVAALIIGGISYGLLYAPKYAPEDTEAPLPMPEKTFVVPGFNTGTEENKTPSTELTSTPDDWEIPDEEELGCKVNGEMTDLCYYVLDNKRYENSEFERRVTMLADDTHSGGRIIINEVVIGGGEDIITYYVVDLYVSKITDILTNVATKENGEISTDDVWNQAEKCGAKFAISGDYFKNSKIGYVIRNGIEYRNEFSHNDYCLLYLDGTMKCYSGKYFDQYQVLLKEGVWQSWAFGPSLFDEKGNVINDMDEFNINGGRYHSTDILDNGIQNKHPRTAIGCVEEGHYVFVLVDGRREGHSSGADLIELSKIMYDEGCKVAYNLDGGRSAVLWYDGKVLNKPYKDGRKISDIIYVK